ncbi:hypothetical protein BaRGS_00026449 [Batillaria attramentaria]|uniref:Uncharacterized protein n=1 Tax=Batillaria attramentaria TaxID=370345 RepID=A0ABD0K5V6_9CAEN
MTVKKRKRNKEEQRVVHQDRSKFLLTTDKYDILKSWRLRSDKARRWNVAEIQESFCISLIDEPTLVQAIVPDKFIREFPHHQDYFHDIFHCVTCTTRIPVLKLDDGGRTVKFEQLLYIPETKQLFVVGSGFINVFEISGLELLLCPKLLLLSCPIPAPTLPQTPALILPHPGSCSAPNSCSYPAPSRLLSRPELLLLSAPRLLLLCPKLLLLPCPASAPALSHLCSCPVLSHPCSCSAPPLLLLSPNSCSCLSHSCSYPVPSSCSCSAPPLVLPCPKLELLSAPPLILLCPKLLLLPVPPLLLPRPKLELLVCTFRKEYVITGSIRGVIKFNELKLTDDTIVQLGFLRDRGTPTFFIRQPFKITVYELYDMYQMFVMTESTAIDYIQRLNGLEEHPDRLMIATSLSHSYVYNPYRRRLYMTISGGEVLILSCKKTPFKTLEIYSPKSNDEQVTSICSMLLVVGSPEIEDVVVFLGMKNGQITLLSSDCFTLPRAVQAHHGDVTCLEPLVEADEKRERVYRTSSLLVSCGSEMCVRLWKIRCHPDEIDGLELRLHPIVQIRLEGLPKHLSAANDRLCLIYEKNTTVLMYDFSRALRAFEAQRKTYKLYTCLKHTPDYDHIKAVWSSDNELLRELVFFDPVISACFATDFGDLFFAKEYCVAYVQHAGAFES